MNRSSFVSRSSTVSLQELESPWKRYEEIETSKDAAETANFSQKYCFFEIAESSSSLSEVSEKEQRDAAIKVIEDMLTPALSFFAYDDDSIIYAWEIIDRWDGKYSYDVLGEAFQRIYFSQAEHPNILCGLSKCLMSYELEEMFPWGASILVCMLNHTNETVKEYAVMLLENWKDKTLCPALRSMDCASDWLKDYVSNVLADLEG